jgi:hypothetical protein
MQNPWLNIPLEDYEGHMSSPGVAQLNALADLFEETLTYCRPESVAILGIAGGNGLDRIDLRVTKRVIGIDIHGGYLDAVRRRYPQLPLRLLCLDLEHDQVDEEPVALVHAALILEHTGIEQCLQNAASLVAPGGHLTVVLQLPSPLQAEVSPTRFAAMRSLSACFHFVDPAKLQEALQSIAFNVRHRTRCELPSGKAFWLGIFGRTSTEPPTVAEQ